MQKALLQNKQSANEFIEARDFTVFTGSKLVGEMRIYAGNDICIVIRPSNNNDRLINVIDLHGR